MPDVSDLLKSNAIKGDKSLPISFTSQVGAGSNWHVLFSEEPIILLYFIVCHGSPLLQ